VTSQIATETPTVARPKLPVGPRVFRWVITIVIVVPAIWSAMGLDLSWDRLTSAPASILNTLRAMVPPDLTPVTIQRAMPKVMESLFVAWVGTMIAATISLPLGILAARNVAGSWSAGIRQLLILIRSVPELLLAMILIPVTGFGPWTGTLAIGLHSVGTLGKLSSEVVEGIDQGPVEAIAGAGGGRIAQIRFGIMPQVMPTIMAYWLYRFEINIRASAVLGAVGVGGIGLELIQQMAFNNFSRVGTILTLTIGVVLVIDMISAKLRRRIISGQREPGPVESFRRAGRPMRVVMLLGAAIVLWIVVFLLIQLQAPAA
jgi:phosphonate transport system permease protein